jgi:hypothetical protein
VSFGAVIARGNVFGYTIFVIWPTFGCPSSRLKGIDRCGCVLYPILMYKQSRERGKPKIPSKPIGE